MRQRAIWMLGGALMVLGAGQALASQLTVGRTDAQAGQTVSVPVSYNPGHGSIATALSTDIKFGKGLTNPRCAAGAALSGGADKTVMCAEAKPGLLRIVVFGFNQDPVPGGELATITFDVRTNGRHRLHVLRQVPLASDADGHEFRVARKSGIVRINTR